MLRKKLSDELCLGYKINYLCTSNHNSDEHELAKYLKFRELRKLNHTVITEAKFKQGGVADILDMTTFTIYEILASESEKECSEKVKKYPSFLDIKYIKAGRRKLSF